MTETAAKVSCQTLAEIVHRFPERGEREAIRLFNGIRILRYSYREFSELIYRCAALFQQQEITKGDRILLWASNSPEWAVVYCACALSGVVAVPLDIRNTPEFARRIAEETDAKLLIRTQFKKEPGISVSSLIAEELFARLQEIAPLDRTPEISPDDVMEIVYTSGTTGAPKGVVLTHGNLASNTSDILNVVPVDSTYHLLSVLPLSHALEQTPGFWTPLAGGGTVLYIRVLKPSALFEVFQRESITAMIVVPRLLALLKQRIESVFAEKHLSGYLSFGQKMTKVLPRSFRKLYFYPVHKKFNTRFHLFVSGGAALPPDIEAFWSGLGFEVIQGYGLTETSPVLTAGRIGRNKLGSVGLPLSHVDIRLSDDNEILARGPNIFSGYFKNPEATAGVFEDGWFKTGDAGEIARDGYLYIRSRKKDIIVTGDGINIYPADIEHALERLPQVKEACVLGTGENEEAVHAVLVLNDGNADGQPIIDSANEQLMPEQRIVSWSRWSSPEFPKTTTMKIKKNEVRKQLVPRDDTAAEKSPIEGSELERILCELGNLELDELRPDACLGQDLGLSSIDRVELISRLEEAFRLDIDDTAVTSETTVAGLDELVQKRENDIAPPVFRRWTRSVPCRGVRWLFERLLLRPLLSFYCDIQSQGMEKLKHLKGPLLVVSNHTSHIDTALIMSLLPPEIGSRICPAAWKEYFDSKGDPLRIKIGKWLAWQITTIGFNIFPLPQFSGFRQSMVYAGEICDKGWSILIFPEGARIQNGQLEEFKSGVGMLAQSLQVPILPVAIKGGEAILPRETGLPKRGAIHIAFGKPFLPEEQSMEAVTQRIKYEVAALWDQL